MDNNYFTIGEISKIKGITIKALRFYDRIGLLKPSYINPDSKYRYYHISQFVYLDIIKAARTMDISPVDLIPFFKSKDSKSLIDFLNLHKEKTRRKMEALADIIHGIDEVNKSVERAEMAVKENEVYLRRLPDRYAVTASFDQNKSLEEYVFDYSELYLAASGRGLVSTYEEGILLSVNDRDEIHPEYLCVFVAGVKDDCRLIQGGDYACVCYTKENAELQQHKLWDYLQQHKLRPLYLVQVGLLTDLLAEETIFLELQARIR